MTIKNRGYCTGFRQGGAETQSCCQVHDRDYGIGVSRRVADLCLKRCLEKAGYPWRAKLFYVVVRLFGWTRYYWIRYKEWRTKA